jgi:hypothetical protein
MNASERNVATPSDTECPSDEVLDEALAEARERLRDVEFLVEAFELLRGLTAMKRRELWRDARRRLEAHRSRQRAALH